MLQILIKTKIKTSLLLSALAIVFIAYPSRLHAFDNGLPPIEESRAYNQYLLRPNSTLSVLIYMIDRFKEADIQVVYDGHSYPASVAGSFARWFLATRYAGQTEHEWIMQYCNKSIFTGERIWVKDRNDNYAEGSKILFRELERLKQLSTQKASLPS